MRDMTARKFETAAAGMGFDTRLKAMPDGLWFIASDAVRVAPVLRPGTVQVDRRATLARMSARRKAEPYAPTRSEATGASTPMASV